jgi:hypothetical protein
MKRIATLVVIAGALAVPPAALPIIHTEVPADEVAPAVAAENVAGNDTAEAAAVAAGLSLPVTTAPDTPTPTVRGG